MEILGLGRTTGIRSRTPSLMFVFLLIRSLDPSLFSLCSSPPFSRFPILSTPSTPLPTMLGLSTVILGATALASVAAAPVQPRVYGYTST